MALPRTLVRLGASPPHLGEMVGLTQPTHREPQPSKLGLSPFFPKWIGAVQEPLGQGLPPPSRRAWPRPTPDWPDQPPVASQRTGG